MTPALRRELHDGTRVLACLAERPAHVGAMFREAVADAAAMPAILDDETTIDYAALGAMVGIAAANLAALPIGAGDRVALLLDNGVPGIVMLLACAHLGAIAVPMNVRQRAPETAFMLNDSGAAVLIHEAGLAAFLPAEGDTPALRHRFAVGDAAAGSQPFAALQVAAAQPAPARVGEDDAFCILYTSGTTGRPKGAVLTHLGVVHSCLNYAHAFGLRRGDRALLAVPASHVTGVVAIILAMIRVRGAIVLMPPFQARRFLEIASATRVTYSLMVPAMYNLCLRDPEFGQFDLSGWRVGGFGGAPMPAATIEHLAQAVPGLALHNIYGATETTSPVTILPGDRIGTHADSVGRALPGCDIRIMDEDGRELPVGTAGELWIAGPMVVPGYWRNPDATAAGFVHGYWRSGDIGTIDADGFVRVFDRKKDMINRGGFKIYSVEVENVLSHHPAIVEAAVLARPCPVLGERVEAFVVTADPAVDLAEVRRFCADRLSDYKLPDYLTVLAAPLPRNAAGKLLKSELRLAGKPS